MAASTGQETAATVSPSKAHPQVTERQGSHPASLAQTPTLPNQESWEAPRKQTVSQNSSNVTVGRHLRSATVDAGSRPAAKRLRQHSLMEPINYRHNIMETDRNAMKIPGINLPKMTKQINISWVLKRRTKAQQRQQRSRALGPKTNSRGN